MGAVGSLIFTVVFSILFILEIKNPKNSYRRVKETSLEKLLNLCSIGFILTLVFSLVLLLVR
jgi:hypothetical protein